jgi:hypothetical protein
MDGIKVEGQGSMEEPRCAVLVRKQWGDAVKRRGVSTATLGALDDAGVHQSWSGRLG